MMQPIGRMYTANEVDKQQAQEMATVGIVPSDQGPDEEPIGHRFEMAGQSFIVTGYATREEFLTAVKNAGLSTRQFSLYPQGMYFQRISTD